MPHTAFRISILISLLILLTACASLCKHDCHSGAQSAVHDILYFGTAKPAGKVTLEEWNQFLATHVTPKFPQGFTSSQASGQWRAANGNIIRETTYLLDIVHPNSAIHEQSIKTIIAVYKTQFQQHAVLRAQTMTCASF